MFLRDIERKNSAELCASMQWVILGKDHIENITGLYGKYNYRRDIDKATRITEKLVGVTQSTLDTKAKKKKRVLKK